MKKKILIVEDDSSILEVMKFVLEDAGYEVTTSVNGNNIININKGLPDLMLLDIWLSDTNGNELCKHLKSRELTKHIPIILCSANSDAKRLAHECGADNYITKPFDLVDLLATVGKYTKNG